MRRLGAVVVVLAVAALTMSPAAAGDAREASADRCDDAPVSDVSTARLRGTLDRPGDVDWYRFEVLGPANGDERLVRILLGKLAVNYRVDVYDGCGERLARSDRSGRAFEDISLRHGAGVLGVRVSSRGDRFSTKPYVLKYETYAPGVVVTPLLLRVAGDRLVVGTQIVNNTAEPRRAVVVRLQHARRCGAGCVRYDGAVDTIRIARLAPAQALPVALRRSVPARYAGTRVTIASEQVAADLDVKALPVWVPTTDVRDGKRVYGGVVENPTGGRVRDVQVTVAGFDDEGRVLDAVTLPVADSMRTRDRHPFQIRRPNQRRAQRHLLAADAIGS